VEDVLTDLGDSFEAQVDAYTEHALGDEIDLDDISATVEKHGYAAFHIDGYSPGADEYVIISDRYLPVQVLRVQETRVKIW
jgi:hypothetical protein